MPRVLVVEDHPVVRNGIKVLLAEECGVEAVGEAGTGGEALNLARAEPWDAVLLDIVLPGQGGLDVLRQLRLERPRLPVIAMSFYLEPDNIRQCLAAGAAGFIVKERLTEDVGPALRLALDGATFLSQDVRILLQTDSGQ
jgi:DNA-binding NarL/FixJ family response regulator